MCTHIKFGQWNLKNSLFLKKNIYYQLFIIKHFTIEHFTIEYFTIEYFTIEYFTIKCLTIINNNSKYIIVNT